MLINDYLIEQDGIDWGKALANWSWILPKLFTLWMVNRFGDLFVVLENGEVFMLNIGGGSFTKIADNRNAFGDMFEDEENSNNWLMIPLIDKLVACGITLQPGQCYSYRTPPILGGDYSVENSCVISLYDHFAGYGKLQEQIKDIPDGTEVRIKTKTGR